MKTFKYILLYTRHISFICYLIAMIVLFPSFREFKFGSICLGISFLYMIVYFIMFLAKNDLEESNILNNCVLTFFHGYICLIAYKYNIIFSNTIGNGLEYFNTNFIMISICMVLLITNRFIIANSK